DTVCRLALGSCSGNLASRWSRQARSMVGAFGTMWRSIFYDHVDSARNDNGLLCAQRTLAGISILRLRLQRFGTFHSQRTSFRTVPCDFVDRLRLRSLCNPTSHSGGRRPGACFSAWLCLAHLRVLSCGALQFLGTAHAPGLSALSSAGVRIPYFSYNYRLD